LDSGVDRQQIGTTGNWPDCRTGGSATDKGMNDMTAKQKLSR